MKYIKLFENQYNIDICKQLISHLNKVFNQLGYDYFNYFKFGLYETEYKKDRDEKFMIVIDPSINQMTINLFEHDNELLFIPEYFKTISGLKFKKHGNYDRFYIIGDIDDIIKQISREDFELKFASNTYNI